LLIGGPVQIFSYIEARGSNANTAHFVIKSDESNWFPGDAEANLYLGTKSCKLEKIGQDTVDIGVSFVAGVKTDLFSHQATANANFNFFYTLPVH